MGRKRKTRRVVRTDRVQATPETLAKLKPWPMQELLAKGRHGGGLESDQFEAALQIVEAFGVISHGLGYKPTDLSRVGHGTGDISPRQCRLWNIYVAWGNEYLRRTRIRPHVVVDLVEDSRAMDPAGVRLVVLAAAIWDRVASNYDREQRVAR
jgi:hypothetical protein